LLVSDSKTYHVQGTKVFTDKYNIYQIHSIDSLILIKNISANSALAFSIYTKNSFTHIADFGTIGDGPNEFEEQVYYTKQFISDNDIKIWVYENNRNKYSLINLTKTIKLGETVVDEMIRIKPGNSYFDLFHIDNETIIGNTDNLAVKMKRLKFFNPVTGVFTKTVALTPKLENPKKNDLDFTQQKYNPLFMNTLRYSPTRKKLVSAMISMDIIDIFNEKGDLVHSINNSEKPIKNVDDYINQNEERVYNTDVKLTDNFIYILYSGDLMSNLYEKSTPTKIKVYDWNYNLKFTINTNDSSNFIAVDETNGFIIGTSLTEEKVMQYDIKDILKHEL